jgi:CIC family chloride channel protein
VFTLELTHAWNDLTSLLVASVSAYLLSALLLKRSVLTEKIARRGLHLTREYSTDPLETFFAREVMTADPVVLAAKATLTDVLPAPAGGTTASALYPVVDANGAVTGVLTHSELLAAAGREPASRTIGELARRPKTLIQADQTLREVANAFAVNGITRAPVVDPDDPGHLVGMVSLAQLLHARRTDHREQFAVREHPGRNGPDRNDPDHDSGGGTAGGMTYPAGLVIVAIARSGSQ